MNVRVVSIAAVVALAVACGSAVDEGVSDDVIDAQYAALDANYEASPFGPQAPRDIEDLGGTNPVTFEVAPPYTEMNLCNIHFHEGAEHRGGEYTTYAGNGDGEGHETGYLYDGELTDDELAEFDGEVGANEHGDLQPGDTIEIHYVHSTDPVTPGPTLGSCLAGDDTSPLLRVEAQVFVLVNDPSAASLVELSAVEEVGGLFQAVNIPNDTGEPVNYAGSTTGPSYNEEGSPFMVSWAVRPEVMKVDIASVGEWLADNEFDETYAHAVRNLVINPDHLSPIDG
jgi:hypothetical protein